MNNPDEQDREKPSPANTSAHNRLHRLIEPPVLFTGIALLVLAVVWGTTLNLIDKERADADRTAATLAADSANTYEAQVVRALREIDQTLKLVRYNLGSDPAEEVLSELRSKGFLPPELLFTIFVTDAGGDIIASTPPIRNEERSRLRVLSGRAGK